ncbi:hypothetical protein CLNEO_13710 [Anaerotignum neopropionicum]|uniref:Uncharacterized protein n=1 Tax=Anaerotignum neopropionicum TaxID=36847 RepID=A0A136WG21_9FIRM|nr:hypothetical protein [Anaerotignum neopropionicum]KXL53400.1 hypothetical protein CLNEO_13710 [Anaerotignum neopropionicum]
MNDITVNERIKITNIKRHEYLGEGVIFAKLIYQGKKYTLKYDYIKKEMLGCAACGYIEMPWNEGRGVWNLIKEALDKAKIRAG